MKPVTAQSQKNQRGRVEVPHEIVRDGRDDFLHAVVRAGRKRNSHARIAAEKENHAALDVPRILFGEVAFLGNLAGDDQGAN